jgi:hypothetical protein
MTDSGTAIVVQFAGQTSQRVANSTQASGDCALVFANSNLGIGATCAWSNSSHMLVTLGGTALLGVCCPLCFMICALPHSYAPLTEPTAHCLVQAHVTRRP